MTLSKDARERNFTIGQEGDSIQVRLRTSKTSHNGIPAQQSRNRSINEALTHVVYARGRSGNAKIFINGRLDRQQLVAGELENWDEQYRLVGEQRPVAGLGWEIFTGSLFTAVSGLWAMCRPASPGGLMMMVLFRSQLQAKACRLLRKEAVPLLSTHCLECHDSATHKGGLDLSRRQQLSKAGIRRCCLQEMPHESFIPVDSDQMPHDRPFLSDSQKQILKQWIDDGAVRLSLSILQSIAINGKREIGYGV